jgi:aspartate beta-hydroxylase
MQTTTLRADWRRPRPSRSAIDAHSKMGIYERGARIIRAVYRRRIQGPPVMDVGVDFPNAGKFLENWERIRAEAMAVLQRPECVPRFEEIMPEQASISAQDAKAWRVFILKAYGVEVPPNMRRCPALASLLAQAPEVLSATFSLLEPGKHIPRHCGPFRGVLRFHLGLRVPVATDGRPAAILTIDGKEHRIANGECLLWDDTYPHEVRNASGEARVALLFDVWRPRMPVDMQLLSRLIIAVVQIGIKWRGVFHRS